MEVVGMIFFWLVLLVGVAVIPFGLAGTFIIVVDAFVYGLVTGFGKITLPFVGFLLLIAFIFKMMNQF